MHKRGGWAYRADSDPETWETVWIGIDGGTIPNHIRKIISVAVQFQMMPALRRFVTPSSPIYHAEAS